eukprot:IDg2048t1
MYVVYLPSDNVFIFQLFIFFIVVLHSCRVAAAVTGDPVTCTMSATVKALHRDICFTVADIVLYAWLSRSTRTANVWTCRVI